MTLNELKKQFLDELIKNYPINEIESFFYMLTEHYLALRRLDIALNPNLILKESMAPFFTEALAKLKKEFPIQYIIGSTDFMGLSFKVDENVLIPRPETEDLVSWILSSFEDKKDIKILDIGTGSGCIPISLASRMEDVHVEAMDISEKALNMARFNAEINKVTIDFILEDILETSQLNPSYDIIVSNPPYVRESEKKFMQKNVLKHEPKLALFVRDDDPLVFYEKIAQLSFPALKNKGQLYFEINQYFGEELIKLLNEIGFHTVELKKDIYGEDRMVRAIKN